MAVVDEIGVLDREAATKRSSRRSAAAADMTGVAIRASRRDGPQPNAATVALWNAVLDRDRRFDRYFVYGVRSTHVYCRPSCPSRRPSRVNTTFFASPEDARGDSYRACKRCNPDHVLRDERVLRMVRMTCDAFDESPDELPTLNELAKKVGTTSGRLHRVFKKLVGITPKQFGDARRMERLKAAL